LFYDGFATRFMPLFLKPYFLKGKYKTHDEIKKLIGVASVFLCMFTDVAKAFPNVCDVVNQPAFSQCMSYGVGSCMCSGPPPRPCASLTYYVPETFIEVTSDRTSSKFKDLPGAAVQLASVANLGLPFGTEGSDFAAFQARTLPVPFSAAIFGRLPCFNNLMENVCFGAMSEHLGASWSTGAADRLQPNFLAWAANPKACLTVGAAKSVVGGAEGGYSAGSPACSTPRPFIPTYPPSPHGACTGWGVFYPRVGVYDGPSQTTASLMVASRMKSLSTEVFQSAPSSFDERWQMVYPSPSQCFREGQNAGFTETAGFVNDRGRLLGRPKDYLYVTWRRVSCCRDYTDAAVSMAIISSLKAACAGLGGGV
jgi:hypothetical protein